MKTKSWHKPAACLALAALLLLAALPLWHALLRPAHAEEAAPEATLPPLRRILEISFNSRPDEMVTAGEVTLGFTIANTSEYDAQNVYLSSADGLHSESIGQIAAMDTLTFNRAYTVSEAELDSGEISFIVSHDAVNGSGEQVNYTVSTPIMRSIAAPMAEFTRQLSSDCVTEGGTVTVTYRVRNTGNVPLVQLRVSDPLGDFIGRVETLEIGETHVFTSRVTLAAAAASQPLLSYSVPAEGDKTYENTLAPREIFIAVPELTAAFAADCEEAVEGGEVRVTLMLRNLGNADYRHITVSDAVYGGVVASSLQLPAGGEPLVVSRVYPVRGQAEYQFHIEAVCQTGKREALDTERLTLPVTGRAAGSGIEFSAAAQTPQIRRRGSVTFDLTLSTGDADGVRQVRVSEQTRGEIRTLEIVPAGAPTALQVTYPVDADTEFTFVAEWTDSEGTHIVRALPVAVEISANGVVPQGEVREARRLFSGESVQMDQSSIYLYLIFGGCVILAGLILALWITSRKERRARRERQALQRQRKREDLEKTNRFVPVKRPAPRKERRERQEEPPRGGTE